MEIDALLIDTNAYAEFKRGNSFIIDVLKNTKNIILCPVVTGELLAGFKIGKKEDYNIKEFNKFIDSKRVYSVSLNNTTSLEYAKILKELRVKGKPIPTNDIWIAAIAKQYQLPILSFDKHFLHIDNLEVISV